MEINSHKRSGPLWQAEPPARGSSDLFERQTKAKDFCPSCLLLKSRWKAAHAFSNLRCSYFIDALFFGAGGGDGGWGGGDEGMCSLEAVCGTGMMSVPWIKPSLFSFSSPFLLAGTTNNKKKIEELISSLKLLLSYGNFLFFGWKDCREAKSFVGQVSVCTNHGCLRWLQAGRLYHFNHTSSILKTPPSINAPLL